MVNAHHAFSPDIILKRLSIGFDWLEKTGWPSRQLWLRGSRLETHCTPSGGRHAITISASRRGLPMDKGIFPRYQPFLPVGSPGNQDRRQRTKII